MNSEVFCTNDLCNYVEECNLSSPSSWWVEQGSWTPSKAQYIQVTYHTLGKFGIVVDSSIPTLRIQVYDILQERDQGTWNGIGTRNPIRSMGLHSQDMLQDLNNNNNNNNNNNHNNNNNNNNNHNNNNNNNNNNNHNSDNTNEPPQPQWHHISSRFATQAVAHEPWLQRRVEGWRRVPSRNLCVFGLAQDKSVYEWV